MCILCIVAIPAVPGHMRPALQAILCQAAQTSVRALNFWRSAPPPAARLSWADLKPLFRARRPCRLIRSQTSSSSTSPELFAH